MSSAPRAIGIGILLGLIGVTTESWLVWHNAHQILLLRSVITAAIAVVIGVIAGLTGRSESIKAAALSGFFCGFLLSWVGVFLAIRNPALLGSAPLSSVESFLTFLSDILAGTMMTSWFTAGVASLAALPLYQTRNSIRRTA